MKQTRKYLQLVPPDPQKQVRDLDERIAGRSLHEYVTERYPSFARSLPLEVTPGQFAHAEGFARYADEALRLCERCPSHGGACDDGDASDRLIAKGHFPVWDTERNAIVTKSCSRWDEYELRCRLEKRALVPRDLLGCRLSTYEPTTHVQEGALRECVKFAKEFDRKAPGQSGLFLSCEQNGVGKTHLAIAVLAELLGSQRVRSGLYWFVPELLDSVRKSYDDYKKYGQIIEKVKRVDLLILDDLGGQKTTDWVKEQITIIANKRWSEGLCTLVTTNVSVSTIRRTLGKRAESRILAKLTGVALDGKDRRK